jgi:phosphopantothenoylcysteine synthetase/decarboxylase
MLSQPSARAKAMNILITAGNTQAMIDRVRCITNIFSGRTGAGIAAEAIRRGHRVTLLTSHPESVSESDGISVLPYRAYEELASLMKTRLTGESWDAVIHTAAVSDYLAAGVYEADANFQKDGENLKCDGKVTMHSRSAGKVKSGSVELWLRLVRAPKLIDRIRGEWRFRGVLVKFKLEVEVTDEELLAVAERSRLLSDADLMVANTLEGAAEWAYLGEGEYSRVTRAELPARLIDAVERISTVDGAR